MKPLQVQNSIAREQVRHARCAVKSAVESLRQAEQLLTLAIMNEGGEVAEGLMECRASVFDAIPSAEQAQGWISTRFVTMSPKNESPRTLVRS